MCHRAPGFSRLSVKRLIVSSSESPSWMVFSTSVERQHEQLHSGTCPPTTEISPQTPPRLYLLLDQPGLWGSPHKPWHWLHQTHPSGGLLCHIFCPLVLLNLREESKWKRKRSSKSISKTKKCYTTLRSTSWKKIRELFFLSTNTSRTATCILARTLLHLVASQVICWQTDTDQLSLSSRYDLSKSHLSPPRKGFLQQFRIKRFQNSLFFTLNSSCYRIY